MTTFEIISTDFQNGGLNGQTGWNVPLAADVKTVVDGNDDEFEIETLTVAHSDHDEYNEEVLRPRLKWLRSGIIMLKLSSSYTFLDFETETSHPSPPEHVSPATSSAHSSNSDSVHFSGPPELVCTGK
ncbi:hypothetical protein Tco_1346525 [Tanacetum coccineum]